MKWTLLQLISVGRKNELVSSNNDSGKFKSALLEIPILLLLLPQSLWTLILIGCSSETFSVGKNVSDFVVEAGFWKEEECIYVVLLQHQVTQMM